METKTFIEQARVPKPRQVPIDAKQMRLWEQTRASLLWEMPGFTHIFYTMMTNGVEGPKAYFTDAPNIPIAATDGDYMFINPTSDYFTRPLPHRVFIAAHEICHAMMGHMVILAGIVKRGKVMYADGTELPFDMGTMNKAMDYVINDMLVNTVTAGAGRDKAKMCPPDMLHDPALITYKDSVVDAYKKVWKKQGGKPSSGGGGFDVHLMPGTGSGKDQQSAISDRSDQEWKTAISGAMAAAKAQGKLPAAMEHVFGDLMEPKVNWQDKIVAFFGRKVGSGSYDWQRPDRRFLVRDIVVPGRTGRSAKCVVVGVDTSGSITDKTVDMFMGEMAGILDDVNPENLVIMWCDAKVHRVDEAEDVDDLRVIRAKGAPGRGGTSFVPVFDKVFELGLEPDALVYLTDGLGTFPVESPRYPVLWGNINPGYKYPWGDVVDIPLQTEK